MEATAKNTSTPAIPPESEQRPASAHAPDWSSLLSRAAFVDALDAIADRVHVADLAVASLEREGAGEMAVRSIRATLQEAIDRVEGLRPAALAGGVEGPTDEPIPLRPVDIPAAPAPGPSRQVSVMGAAADELGDINSELTTLTLAISACTSGASIRDHGDDMIRTVDRIVERIRRVQLELVDGRLPPAEVSR